MVADRDGPRPQRSAALTWALSRCAPGCGVIFLDQPPRDNPQDALLVQIRSAAAEDERTISADHPRRRRRAALPAGRLVPSRYPPTASAPTRRHRATRVA